MLNVAGVWYGRRTVVGGEAQENLPQVRVGDAALDLGRERAGGRDFAEMAQLREIA